MVQWIFSLTLIQHYLSHQSLEREGERRITVHQKSPTAAAIKSQTLKTFLSRESVDQIQKNSQKRDEYSWISKFPDSFLNNNITPFLFENHHKPSLTSSNWPNITQTTRIRDCSSTTQWLISSKKKKRNRKNRSEPIQARLKFFFWSFPFQVSSFSDPNQR